MDDFIAHALKPVLWEEANNRPLNDDSRTNARRPKDGKGNRFKSGP